MHQPSILLVCILHTSKTLSFVTLSAAKAIPTGNDVLCYLAVGMVGLVFGEGVYGYRLPKTITFLYIFALENGPKPQKGKACFEKKYPLSGAFAVSFREGKWEDLQDNV